MPYEFGEVLLVRFPFTSQTGFKQRPAVVISDQTNNLARREAVIMSITSQIHSPSSSGDLRIGRRQAANLLKPSAIKPVFATVEQKSYPQALGHVASLGSIRTASGNCRASGLADGDMKYYRNIQRSPELDEAAAKVQQELPPGLRRSREGTGTHAPGRRSRKDGRRIGLAVQAIAPLAQNQEPWSESSMALLPLEQRLLCRIPRNFYRRSPFGVTISDQQEHISMRYKNLHGLLLFSCLSSAIVNAEELLITSNPLGATIEIDGKVVGKTPYVSKLPGGYFHKTATVFQARLEHPLHMRLSKEGYVGKDIDMTEGPMRSIALNGVDHGNYYLLKDRQFSVTLSPEAKEFTAPLAPPSATPQMELASAELSIESIVDQTSSAVLKLSTAEGSGSGFLVTSGGVVVTNAHVVGNNNEVTVKNAQRQHSMGKSCIKTRRLISRS